MWVRLIHLAQQQQRNTYRIIKIPKDSMDSKWGFTSYAEKWDGGLAMMGFIIGLALSYSPVKESLIRSGLGDDEKKD